MRKIFKFSLPTTILFLTLFFSANLNGQTIRSVCESGCDYPTIQEAIDAADPADVIEVGPGTYDENITIDKALTLIGANQNIDCDSRVAESVIAPTSGAPVVISSDGVSINGFEINAPSHGVAIELSNTSNVSVLYNKVHNIGNDPGFGGPPTNTNTVHSIRYQLDGGSYSNINISNNCISNLSHSGNTFNSASGIGFLQSTSLGTLTNLTIEGNTIENVNSNTGDWSAGGRIAYGILINVGGNTNFNTNGKVVAATISGNEISNLEGFISTGIGLEGNTENAVVTGNTISNLTGHKVGNRAGGGYDLQALKFENNRYVGTVTVEHNSFQTNTFTHSDPDGVGYAVANYVDAGEYGAADVSCNWFGTADATAIADNEDMDGLVFAKEDAEITFTPFLVDDDIDNPDCSGLAPVSVYDGDPDDTGVLVSSHFNIQEGIDAADVGYFIVVGPGTYDDGDVTLDKDNLQLIGPNNGIAGHDPNRNDEAVIHGRVELGEKSGSGSPANGAVFRGFTVENIASLNYGIGSNSDDILIEDNIIRDFTTGFTHSLASSNQSQLTATIKDNLFEGQVSAISTEGAFEVIIENNKFLNNRNAIGFNGDDTEVFSIADNEFVIDDVEALESSFQSNARYISVRGELEGSPAEEVLNNNDNSFSPEARFALSANNTTNIVPIGSGEISPVEIVDNNGVAQSGYPNIQDAIDAAAEGDNIEIAEGTYDEPLTITTNDISLIGLDGGANLEKSGNRGGVGISLSANGVHFENLQVSNRNSGLRLTGDVDGLTIDDCQFTNCGTAFWAEQEYSHQNITIENSGFDNNTFGWQIINTNSGNPNVFDHITVTNTTFNNNTRKGLYIERLRNAAFDGIVVDNSGTDADWGFPNGMDINLKWDEYSDVTIINSQFTNSGVMGTNTDPENPASVTIKARDDGSSYGATPATLDNVTFSNNYVSGPENGLRFGEFGTTNETPTNVTVENNHFGNAYNNKALIHNVDAPLVASCNWFGTTDGSEIEDLISGNLTVAPALDSGDDSGSADPGFSPVGNCNVCVNGVVTNTTQITTYCFIQDAIDAADDGNVIEVGPGTYNEALEILTDNLTLVSADGAATTIIDAGGATNGIMIGDHSWTTGGTYPTGVTVEGFTVTNWEERGISQRNGTGTVYIRDNTLEGPVSGARNGINISGGTNSEITGNNITTSSFNQEDWSGTGILLMGSENALVENNSVLGADLGIVIAGYPDWNNNDPSWVSASGNSIKGNTVNNCVSGIALAGEVSNNTIEENTIESNERGVNEYPQLGGTPSGNVVDNNTIEDNEWGIRISSSLNGEPDYDPAMTITNNSFTNNFPFQVRDFSAQLDVEDVVVNSTFDRGVYLEGGSAHVGSVIQSFLNNDNVTVNVLPGIYEEVLEIVERDDISIVGTDKATTIVRASNNDLLNWPAYHPSSSRKTAVLVDRSEEIHISGFTFDFDNVGTGQGHTGLMMWNSTGSFQDNAFINRGKVGYETDFNAYVGADETTIYDDNNRAEVLFKGNEFENTGRVGLNVQNFVFLTVEDNSFTKTFDDPGYAIEMSSLSNGLIKDNTISNFNTSFSDNSSSSGIYIHNNFTQGFINPFIKQVDVEGNTIDNCTHGIYIGSTSGGTHWNIIGNVSIESSVIGNTITNSETSAIFVTDDGASLGSEITADFENNSIDGGDNGYHLNTYWGDGVLNVSISNGKIENVGTGILVIDFNDFYNDPSDSEYYISITETSISNFSDFAIRNQYHQITLSATCNWYGTINSAEIAASISGDVTFFPWLTSGVDTEPGQPGFVPETGACDDPIFIQLEAKDDLSCLGGDDGAINVTVSGGQTPYSYQWSGPAGFSSTDQNISGLEEGVYELTVTDDNDATGIFSSEILPPSEGVNLDQVNDIGPICAGDQLEVSFNASGHGDTYTYAWTNDNTEVGAASGTGNIDFQVANATSEVQTATFSVIATNNLGCESDPITFEVTVGCVTISGTITELDGTPMEGVSVNLTGDDEQTTATNSSGVYSFDQTAGSSFVIAPDLDQLFQNPADLSNFGVASNDATAILNHLNGSQILNGIPLISADTRTTNNVTGADRAVIVVGLLGNPVAINFWNFKSWYFIETDHDFNNPAIPWDYASTITVEGQNGIVGDIDFHGFRKGDITGTIAAVDDFHNPVSRSADIVNMLMKEKELQSGQSFEVDVRFSDFESITSMQFALEFDPNAIEFLEVKIGEVLSEFDEQNVGLFGLDQGILRFVWATSSDNAQTLGNDDVVFTLVFDNHSQDGGKLSEFLGISDNDISALAFTSHMEMPIEALFEEALSTEDMFGDINHFSAKAQPNPFSGRTDIQFKMPVAGEVQFDIYTADGKQVSNFVRNFQAGTAEVAIDDQIIEYPGLYLIKLRSETGTSILRLVRTEQ